MAAMKADKGETARVVVKLRPKTATEEEALGDTIRVPAPGRVVVDKDYGQPLEIEADHIYLPDEGDAVYDDEVAGLVASLYEGFNSTVFAYGASGAGKTHTLIASNNNLVDRIIDDVFVRYDPRTCTVSVSVEELYRERFTDLLAPVEQPVMGNSGSFSSTSSGGSLSSRMRGSTFTSSSGGGSSASSSSTSSGSGGTGKPRREGAGSAQSNYSWTKATLGNSAEMKELVHRTLRKRHTANTALNEKSSRSHAIITIMLEQRKQVFEHKHLAGEASDAPGSGIACGHRSSEGSTAEADNGSKAAADTSGGSQDGREARSGAVVDDGAATDISSSAGSEDAAVSTYLLGKLYLVDLAGSEDIKRSGADSMRQKEAGIINKSLCHLKSVIEQIHKQERVATYRNSKLTLRLQDALGGGNSKLLVIACISTARSNLQVTKETLRFAMMARAITNTPMVNCEPKDELIQRLQLQLVELQDQLNLAKAQGGKAAADELLQQQLHAMEVAYADLQEQQLQEQEQQQLLQEQHERLQEQHERLQKQHQQLQEQLEAKEQHWITSARSVTEQVGVLHGMLSTTQASEASLRQQLAAQRQASDQLQQALEAEQGQRQSSQAAGSAAAALLASMAGDVAAVQEQCSSLQQQLACQHAAAQAAVQLCEQQQQAAQHLQQQLQLEQAARSAAEQEVHRLRQQASAAQQLSESAAAELQESAAACEQLQAALVQAAHQHATAQQQLLLIEQAAQAAEASRMDMEAACQQQCSQIAKLLEQLQQERQHHAQQLGDAAAKHAAALEAHAAELASARAAHSQQLQDAAAQHAAALQDAQRQRAEQLQEAKAAHEAALAAAAAAQQAQQAEWQQQLEQAMAQAAMTLQAERQKHQQQLEDIQQSSVKKLAADKLRCKQHLAINVRNIMADAQSLSKALESKDCLMLRDARTSHDAGSNSSSIESSSASSSAGSTPDASAANSPRAALPGPAGVPPLPLQVVDGGGGFTEAEESLAAASAAGMEILRSSRQSLQQSAGGALPSMHDVSENPLFEQDPGSSGDDDSDCDEGSDSMIAAAGSGSGFGSMSSYEQQRRQQQQQLEEQQQQEEVQHAAAAAAKTAALVAVAAAAAASTATKVAAANRQPASPVVPTCAEAGSGNRRASSDRGAVCLSGSPVQTSTTWVAGTGSPARPRSSPGVSRLLAGRPSSRCSDSSPVAKGLPPLLSMLQRTTSNASVLRYANSVASSVADDGSTCCDATASPLPPPASVAAGDPAVAEAAAHAAATAAATAATAVAAAAVEEQHRRRQQQRQRQRQRQSTLQSGFAAGSWPSSYGPKESVDYAAAAMAFAQLRGGALTVEGLHTFLEHRMLGGRLHSKTLCGGQWKRKHELIQDMLAYHRWHLASCALTAAVNNRSSSGGLASGSGSATARSSTASSSLTASSSSSHSSVGANLQQPLEPAAPEAAAAAAAAVTPRAAAVAGSDSTNPYAAATPPAAAAGDTSNVSEQATCSNPQCDVDTAIDASRAARQVHRAADQQQGAAAVPPLAVASAAGSPGGMWAWLTPRRKKQQSMLAQLKAAGCTSLPQPCSFDAAVPFSPTGSQAACSAAGDLKHSTELVPKQQQQPCSSSSSRSAPVQLLDAPGTVEQGVDAVSPRDKQLYAAAARATASGGSSSSRANGGATTATTKQGGGGGGSSSSKVRGSSRAQGNITPGGPALISACTGSVVRELAVKSPTVKLARPGSGNSSTASKAALRGYISGSGSSWGGGAPPDGAAPGALTAEAPSIHRSSWRQVQLLKPK